MENRINEIKTQHHYEDGVYMREMELPKGWEAVSHIHKFNHMSILSKGSVVVTVDGIKKVYQAPKVINMLAGVNHSIYALEDTLWFCVHHIEESDFDLENIEKILIEEV